jgi:hypothetical protein
MMINERLVNKMSVTSSLHDTSVGHTSKRKDKII